MTTIKHGLAKPPDHQMKQEIGRAFFGEAFDQEGGLEAFKDYFNYYEEEIDWLRRGVTSETDQLAGIVCKTHDDLLVIAKILRKNAKCTKSEIRAKLRECDQFDDAEDWAFDRSIDITIRLWLQINVRDELFRDSGKGVPDVQWNGSETLTEFLRALFPVAKWELGAKERRLDPYFTGANMVDICDLKIDWTTSLEDHLRLDRVERVLWIFPHKRTLQAFLSEAENKVAGKRSPIPITVLQETIRTLDLLFPFWHARTKTFLKSQGHSFHEIGPFEQGRTLHLLDFAHWKDRLFEVYEEIYQTPPVSWAQLRRDRRNPQQFWTFWIALYILGLTLLSTLAGLVSMVTGIVQMNLAVIASQKHV